MITAITPQQLFAEMESNSGTVILDVRKKEAFDEWHIQHPTTTVLNIQTSKLMQHGVSAYPELPKDQTITVVCAKGNASEEAAVILDRAGYRVNHLARGMDAWSEFYYSVPVVKRENLTIIQIIRPAKGCLSYMMLSGMDAIVVDPARHTTIYRELADRHQVQIRHILDTHCHADHISGGVSLADETSARYWISAEEMSRDAVVSFESLTGGMEFDFGDSTLQVLAIPTPGHTPGSMSFLVNEQFLLSGDTVFVSGLGRPDLGGKAREWASMLFETVNSKLSKLPNDLLVLPAHFSDVSEMTDEGYVGSTLGHLRDTNALLSEVQKERFTNEVAAQVGATPPNYATIVQVNRGLVVATDDEAREFEIGPNRCAVKHLG